jgi:SAM-dependent methyltransferase
VSAAHGSGPGAIARDGCAVDLYAAMPPAREAALVCAAIPPAQAILELGAGAGRMTHPLVAAGHRVVAVDESAEMLARIRGAETVEARIEDLRLAERFDVVLLASHLVNEPDAQTRTALLDACARHVGDDGCVLVERHPPAWFEGVRPGTTAAGALTMTLRDVGRPEPGLVEATIDYRLDERTWTQRFTARRLDDDQLAEALAASGLRLAGFLDDACAWARAELLRPRPRTRPRRAATAAMPPGSSGSPRG